MDGCRLRRATMEDMDLIFRWANEEEARRNSFHTEPIPYEDHCKWYRAKMGSDAACIYILCDGDACIGQTRIDIEGDSAVISYFVDPMYRNRGYGKTILRLLHETVAAEHIDILFLIARVKPDNIPSRAVFEALGYEMRKADGEMIEYVYRLCQASPGDAPCGNLRT